MSDRASLLSNVLENPDDDAPRLAYADCLKKNGDADRAELIRVQCKRAERDEYDPTQEGLKKKEKTLLNKHGKRWQAELPKWACAEPRTNPQFRRGFVGQLSIPLTDFVARGDELVRTTPLEALDLTGQEASVEELRGLGQCPHAARLTELHFWSTNLKNDGVKALANSPHLARLRVLRLGPLVSDASVKALAATKQLTALTTLYAYCQKIGMAGVRALQSAPFKLKSLSILLPPQGAEALAGMSNLSELTYLDVSSGHVDAAGAKALAASPYLKNLRVLYIGHNPLTTAGVASLAESATFANLRELHVQNSRLEDEDAWTLMRSPHLAGLKQLVLVNNNLSLEVHEELRGRFGP